MIVVTDADHTGDTTAAVPVVAARSSPDAAAPPPPSADLGLLVSLAAAVVAGLGLAVTARTSALALLVAVAVVQAAFALAWVFGTQLPGRRGALLIAAAAAGGADAVVSVWPHGRLGALVAVLGLALPVLFVHQLARGAARVQIVASLAAIAALVIVEVSLPALLQLRHEFVEADQGGRVAHDVQGEALAGRLAPDGLAGDDKSGRPPVRSPPRSSSATSSISSCPSPDSIPRSRGDCSACSPRSRSGRPSATCCCATTSSSSTAGRCSSGARWVR